MIRNRIADLRKKQGLSQGELAKKIHVSASAVGMYEQGRRTPELGVLIRLAQLFDVTLDYLVLGVKSGNRSQKDETSSPEKVY